MGKKKSVSHKIVTGAGKRKTFQEDSDEEDKLDLEMALENDDGEQSESGDDDAPEVGGTNKAEMQRLRQMFEQHAPMEREAKKKKKKRKARPAEEVDESEKIDTSIFADIDENDLDAHKRGQEEDGHEESDEDEENKKKGLKISKNKRSSKKIGDLDVAVLKDENPVSMMIKTGHKGSKMKDMLSAGEGQRVEYSVFSSQKKRQPAKKFKL